VRLNLYLYPGATTEADGVLRSAIPPSLDGLLYPGATSSTDGVLRFQILVPAPAESTSEASPIEVAFLDSTATVYGPSVGAAVAAVAIGSGATVPAPAIGAGIVAGFVASADVVYAPTVESGTAPEPEPAYIRPIGGWVEIPYTLRNRRRFRRKRVEEEELVALAASED